MKTIIIYTSKHGTTERVAVSIAEKLKAIHEVTLCALDINTEPNIGSFDTVVLGTPIYAGLVSKKMKVFCQMNETVLLQKKTGLFVCGMEPD